MAQRELRQIFPRPGWVEHDPVEIWESQLAAAREARIPVGFTPCITQGMKGEQLTEMAELRDLGAVGFTDDGRLRRTIHSRRTMIRNPHTNPHSGDSTSDFRVSITPFAVSSPSAAVPAPLPVNTR